MAIYGIFHPETGLLVTTAPRDLGDDWLLLPEGLTGQLQLVDGQITQVPPTPPIPYGNLEIAADPAADASGGNPAADAAE